MSSNLIVNVFFLSLVVGLELGEKLSGYAGQVERRKIAWQRARNTTPPLVLPEKSFAPF